MSVLHNGQIIAEGTPEDLINHHGGGNTLIIRKCSENAKMKSLKLFPIVKLRDDILIKLAVEDGMKYMSQALSIINRDELACEELYVKKQLLKMCFEFN